MIKFGFKGFQTEFPNWSKHHKTLGVFVKRVYTDDKVIITENQALKKLVEENSALLTSKSVQLYDRKTGERKGAVDYYFPLQNLNYQEVNIDYYSVGAMNTQQTTHFRLIFLIEDSKFILDYNFKSKGSYATSFYNFVDGISQIEDIIKETIEKEKSLEEYGIAKGSNEDYQIVAVSPIYEFIDFEIERQELLNSLIGIEIYKFDQEIIDY